MASSQPPDKKTDKPAPSPQQAPQSQAAKPDTYHPVFPDYASI